MSVNCRNTMLFASKLLAETAYITRERMGKGQVILFAGRPTFRGYFHGTERLLINAMLFGPGLGSRQPIPW